jgi:hypothetical protein
LTAAGCSERDFYTPYPLKKVIRLLYSERQTLYGIENKTKHIAFEDLKSCLKAEKVAKVYKNF